MSEKNDAQPLLENGIFEASHFYWICKAIKIGPNLAYRLPQIPFYKDFIEN